MDILGAILITCFVILLFITAITFGFAIITAFLILTFITAAVIAVRTAWYRWQYTKASSPPPQDQIIEGEYKDISHKE